MLLKDLVLNSLESFDSFKIQYSYYQGKVKELPLTKQLYEQLADTEIDHYYLDVDENKKPYISLKFKN
jgi:hypothetical protein